MSKAIPTPPGPVSAPTPGPVVKGPDSSGMPREAAVRRETASPLPLQTATLSREGAAAIGAAKSPAPRGVDDGAQGMAGEKLRGILFDASEKISHIINLCAAGQLSLPQAEAQITQCLNQALARPQVRANPHIWDALSRLDALEAHGTRVSALAGFAQCALKNPTDFAYGAVKGIAKEIDRLRETASATLNPLAGQLQDAATETAKDMTDAARGFVDGANPIPGQPRLGPAYDKMFPYAFGHAAGATAGIAADAASIAAGFGEIGGGGALAVATDGVAVPVSAAAMGQGAALITAGLAGFAVHGGKLLEPLPQPEPLEARSLSDLQASGKRISRETTLPSRAADPAAKPRGAPHVPNEKMRSKNAQSLEAEIEAGEACAKKGFDAEWLPVKNDGKSPDLKLEGKTFDVYTPRQANAQRVFEHTKEKIIEEQTDRVLINLKFNSVSLRSLEEQFAQHPVQGLKEVIVLKDGEFFYLKLASQH